MSKSGQFNLRDLKIVAKNALLFLAPVLIVELELVQKGASVDELLIAFKVWGFGVALDFLRKVKAGK